MHPQAAPSRGSFARPLALPGWSGRSAWGYDALFECYWVELWPVATGGTVRIGPERLIVTLGGLARVVARAVDVPADDAYLALTA